MTIAELTACCVKFKASAARVMCWRSATATKVRSCSRVYRFHDRANVPDARLSIEKQRQAACGLAALCVNPGHSLGARETRPVRPTTHLWSAVLDKSAVRHDKTGCRVYAAGSAGVSHSFASSMWCRADLTPFTSFASSM